MQACGLGLTLAQRNQEAHHGHVTNLLALWAINDRINGLCHRRLLGAVGQHGGS